MKRILKTIEPRELSTFRNHMPQSTWEQMRNDAQHNGQEVYGVCREQLIRDQGGLCAYCEIDIRDNDPLKCRIEHFHPKSDVSTTHNWALDWNNLLGVCVGGSYKHSGVPYTQEPLAQNLSCDAHKDQWIQTGKLTVNCDGWILNPTQLMSYPNLFRVEKSTGKLVPRNASDYPPTIPFKNNHKDIQSLVQHTIDALNLNCDRLCNARILIIRNIERNKKKERDKGSDVKTALQNLSNFYMRKNWPQFFTTIRYCLEPAADEYLNSNNFQG